MKKVVFSGTINGETFDNVHDYNEKMNELLGTGETISASSKTEIKEECEPAEKTQALTDLTPYFDRDDHYLDRLVTGCGDTDAIRLQMVQEDIAKARETLKAALDADNFSVDEALDAMNKYKTIRDSVLDDKRHNESAKANLKESIDEQTKELDFLYAADPFIDALYDCYTDLFNLVKNALLSF